MNSWLQSLRVQVIGVVVRGAGPESTRAFQFDPTGDATADLPGFTPVADNSLALAFAGVRFNASTAPTVAPVTGSRFTEVGEVSEGRAAVINFTGWVGRYALTGQGGLAQPADQLALTGANAVDASYVLVFPPA